MLTCGVKSLPSIMRRKIIEAVAAFKDFSAGNDPHNEHDFGAIEVDGNKISWNARVLTIMLAREY
jgi:hypothetical protein